MKHNSYQTDPGLQPLFDFTNYENQVCFPYDESKLNLDRMRALLEHTGNLHQGYPAIHLAGTKGKGSTAIYIESILRTAGVRTGLFTSPHLERLEERFAIDGIPIQTEQLVAIVQELVPYLEKVEQKPTFFEIITAIAWILFDRRQVVVPIFEVGMGGRLDSTNLIEPAVCIITNIGIDHTRQLGSTHDAIAVEKAGILKAGVPAVTAAREGEGLEVIRATAQSVGAPLFEINDPYTGDLSAPGDHQRLNAACAVKAAQLLHESGTVSVQENQIVEGLRKAVLPGRIELVRTKPKIILDAAHNGSSVHALVKTLSEEFEYDKLIVVLAILGDKMIDDLLKVLVPVSSAIITTRCNSPRGVAPEELAAKIRTLSHTTTCLIEPSPSEALAHAKALAGSNDLICVTGSTYLAGEIRHHLRSLA